MQFKSLADLQKALPSMLQTALVATDDVRSVVAREVSEAVEEEVYNAYEPEIYQRRGLNDGLADPRNVELVGLGNLGGKVKMVFENTTTGADSMSGKMITDLIQNGGDGWNNPNGAWSSPRPFLDVATDKLQSSGELTQAIRTALKKSGFNTN